MTEHEYTQLQNAFSSHLSNIKEKRLLSQKESDTYKKAVLACKSILKQEYTYRLKEKTNTIRPAEKE